MHTNYTTIRGQDSCKSSVTQKHLHYRKVKEIWLYEHAVFLTSEEINVRRNFLTKNSNKQGSWAWIASPKQTWPSKLEFNKLISFLFFFFFYFFFFNFISFLFWYPKKQSLMIWSEAKDQKKKNEKMLPQAQTSKFQGLPNLSYIQ